MKNSKMELTAKEILEKEFKVGFRGYSQQEVDHYLDLVIKDYETLHQELSRLEQENLRLKKENSKLIKSGQAVQPAPKSNIDILKRISNLERHVFGKKLNLD